MRVSAGTRPASSRATRRTCRPPARLAPRARWCTRAQPARCGWQWRALWRGAARCLVPRGGAAGAAGLACRLGSASSHQPWGPARTASTPCCLSPSAGRLPTIASIGLGPGARASPPPGRKQSTEPRPGASASARSAAAAAARSSSPRAPPGRGATLKPVCLLDDISDNTVRRRLLPHLRAI